MYMADVTQQIDTGVLRLGEIVDGDTLLRNLRENAIPENIASVTAGDYEGFLHERRQLMAAVMRRYFEQL